MCGEGFALVGRGSRMEDAGLASQVMLWALGAMCIVCSRLFDGVMGRRQAGARGCAAAAARTAMRASSGSALHGAGGEVRREGRHRAMHGSGIIAAA